MKMRFMLHVCAGRKGSDRNRGLHYEHRPMAAGWWMGGGCGVVWSLLGGLALSVVRHSAELTPTPAMTAIHETHDLKKN